MLETSGFVRKFEDGREADFRLANRRLQPLGHLTATRTLSIRDASSCGNASVPSIVPEIVPAEPITRLEVAADWARPIVEEKRSGFFRDV